MAFFINAKIRLQCKHKCRYMPTSVNHTETGVCLGMKANMVEFSSED